MVPDGSRRGRLLDADLEHGLRRLKLASIRRIAPEMLATAKTQRWAPEELLRALVEVEITARDASNARLRTKQAGFPTVKTIEQFDLAASSIPAQTWSYLTSLDGSEPGRTSRSSARPGPARATP